MIRDKPANCWAHRWANHRSKTEQSGCHSNFFPRPGLHQDRLGGRKKAAAGKALHDPEYNSSVRLWAFPHRKEATVKSKMEVRK